jgi:hypothetical protein
LTFLRQSKVLNQVIRIYRIFQRIFQQDKAPAHNAIIVREYLNQTFGNKWMGTYGQVQWLTRSPDIILLDYFLRGHLKTLAYENSPINLDDLKNKIIIAFNEFTEDQITATTQRENYLDEWKHTLKIMTIILNSL